MKKVFYISNALEADKAGTAKSSTYDVDTMTEGYSGSSSMIYMLSSMRKDFTNQESTYSDLSMSKGFGLVSTGIDPAQNLHGLFTGTKLNRSNNTNNIPQTVFVAHRTSVDGVSIVMDTGACNTGHGQLNMQKLKGSYKTKDPLASLFPHHLRMMSSNAILHIDHSAADRPQDKSRLERGLGVVRRAQAWRQPVFVTRVNKEGFYSCPGTDQFPDPGSRY